MNFMQIAQSTSWVYEKKEKQTMGLRMNSTIQSQQRKNKDTVI